MSDRFMKLGKAPARRDPRNLKMAAYVGAGVDDPPQKSGYAGCVAQWPMLANDRVGNCTVVTAAHLIHVWTACARPPAVVLDEAQAIDAYRTVAGYDPADPSTDGGAVVADVLGHWRKLGIAGRRVAAYVATDPRDVRDFKLAVHLFGGAYVGLRLPQSAQRQRVWVVKKADLSGSSAPDSWGGHAVPVVGYDPEGVDCVTWGKVKRMSWAFLRAYCDEAFCVLSEDWIAADWRAPSGFDLERLRADLRAVAG